MSNASILVKMNVIELIIVKRKLAWTMTASLDLSDVKNELWLYLLFFGRLNRVTYPILPQCRTEERL